FTYGPNHERRTQTQGTSAITYYGGAQEVLTDVSHNVTEIKTYWPMGLGVEIDRPGQAASELDWTHTDHLGSVIAMTDIDGNLKEALGYDAWGNRRNAVGAPVSIATTKAAQVDETTDNKGYTGAEQITSLELVHLNGRVYDPLIGKFLSPDPHVTDPKNGQNYNRYSYVLNNPMNLTDPTGFDHIVDDWYEEGAGGGGGGGGGDYGEGYTDYSGGSESTSDSSPKEVTPEKTGTDSTTKTEQKTPSQQIHDSEGWTVVMYGSGPGPGASAGAAGGASGGAEGAANTTATLTAAGATDVSGQAQTTRANIVGSPTTDAAALSAMGTLSNSGSSEQGLVGLTNGNIVPIPGGDCDNSHCDFNVSPGSVLFTDHTHVPADRSDYSNPALANYVTGLRSMPGPGDGQAVLITNAPAYIQTPTGTNIVLEYINNAFFYTPFDSNGNRQDPIPWTPAMSTPSPGVIRRLNGGF
ncbi:RHS repeat-associated protein, partial [Oxalobacteraceae bacterium GrIS 1.18]